MRKKALITGVNGQDGSLLADLLVEKGYEVHGTLRSLEGENKENIAHLDGQISLHQCDFFNLDDIRAVLKRQEFDEIYHLAAITFVPDAKNNLELVLRVNTDSLRVILEHLDSQSLGTKVFYASSAEVFGHYEGSVNEETPARPGSAYGLSKELGQKLIEFYQRKGLFCCYGILFNHESVRRGERFVTRKITKTIAAIKKNEVNKIILGNIEAYRDWGSAEEFVEAFHLMLQLPKAQNFVIGTGEPHSVKDILELLFTKVGLNYTDYLEISEEFYREEPNIAKTADIVKAKSELGWSPRKSFENVFSEMLESDLK